MEIYMDHAATTAVHPAVLQEMEPYFTEKYYNPSGNYRPGQAVKQTLYQMRERIAAVIGAEPEEIFFTGGGTESDNWVIQSYGQEREKGHIITTRIEHHAIGHSCKRLERQGGSVTYLNTDKRGRIHLSDVRQAIRKETSLISVMYANNEIGTIQPVSEIGALAKEYGIPFHTDAVQACGQIPIHVKRQGISLMSASAHKFHGPKGTGFLYAEQGIKLYNLLEGGAQESGIRSGTENVPGIVGMAAALELASRTMEARMQEETKLRDYMITRIVREIPYARLNGHSWYRLPNNINVAFRFVNSVPLLVWLDMNGICASGGSACNSGSTKPSHVIEAIQVPDEYKQGVIRLTIGEENTKEDADRVVELLKTKIQELRLQSPEYEDFMRNSKPSAE